MSASGILTTLKCSSRFGNIGILSRFLNTQSHFQNISSNLHHHHQPIYCKRQQLFEVITNRRYLHISHAAMAKTALVVITTGSEEMEAVTPIDTLRRAGVEVTVAGLNSAGDTVMSRNVIFGAEKSLKDALASAPFDAIILPGGLKGAEAFVESEELGQLLKEQEKAGRLVAAVCAAPTALYRRDLFLGKSLTSHPLVQERMSAGGKYQYKEDRVVIDGNLITSRGPGTALEWSLAITAYLLGQEKADDLSKAMLAK